MVQEKDFTIALTNNEEEVQTWILGFKVTCPSSIENTFYRVQPTDEEQFIAFAEAFRGVELEVRYLWLPD